MSQTDTKNKNKKSSNNYYYGIRNKPAFKNARDKSKYYYPTGFQYYNSHFGYQPPYYFQWRRPPFRKTRPNRPPEEPPRPPSPFSGTEEYTLKKIQEASDMIKKQLMMPETSEDNSESTAKKSDMELIKNCDSGEKKSDKCESERTTVKNCKKVTNYNVEEIHNKIINHITKLNYGKKMNLICATSSGYDEAIQQIQRQKRLELSKVLRDMCSNQSVENSDVINAIIPDIGIKIEDLPLEVIQRLSSTLDLNFDEQLLQNTDDETVKIKTELCKSEDFEEEYCELTDVKIKNETCEDISNFNNVNESCMDTIEVTDSSKNFSQTSTTLTDKYHDLSDVKIKSEICENINNFNDVNESCMNTTEDTNSSNNFSQASITVKSGFNSEGSQTNSAGRVSNSTQTESDFCQFQVNSNVVSLEEAINSMMAIDKEIARLTELRQSIFLNLQSKSIEHNVKNTQVIKQKARVNTKADVNVHKDTNNSVKEVAKKIKKRENMYQKELKFEVDNEKILVIQVFENTLLAGTASGKIFYIDINNGTTLATIYLGNFPITSFCFCKTSVKFHRFFVSSFDSNIQEYSFLSRTPARTISIKEGVQCMEMCWNYIFIGTVEGNLKRFSLKHNRIEFETNVSPDRILVLKATQEGARKVLLVGTKIFPVCVRDAMSGLHMRTMNDIVTPTVYSLLLNDSLVYCGTTFHDILVYNFNDGSLIRKYQASNSKGISCMKIVKNLLFASSHNGSIYVYNIKTRQYVGVIEGQGGVILSMEIFKNLIIIGTMTFNFKSILIPDYILDSN